MSEQANIYFDEAVALLQQLIATPSFSKQEENTAALVATFFSSYPVTVKQVGNNVLVTHHFFDAAKPSILLNSHHDTVKPNSKYTRDPFLPTLEYGKLFGLGSNDAGGCLVSLIAAFLFFLEQEDPAYNLVLAATAEEEISGTGGIQLALQHLPTIDFAIVGEPTQMQMAVAEKGLMVLDGNAGGIAGHAARIEGENAIYKAVHDIAWFEAYQFDKVSDLLGPVKMTVTVIETENKAHNIIPAACHFVVDVRVNELYQMEEVLQIIRQHTQSEISARSTRLRSSSIALDHPVVKAGLDHGKTYYGSPTTSDKALMPFPALKMGPGNSARSHAADEFIYLEEIENGIKDYIQILKKLL